MTPIVVSPPTQTGTLTLRLLSPETLPILQHLERVHLLEILPNMEPTSKPNSASWMGVLSPEEATAWRLDIEKMRDEWDRDS